MVKAYPGIIHKEDSYWIEFPDLEGCVTVGDTIEELLEMAHEAMGGYLASMVDRGLALPESTPIDKIDANGCATTYVSVDVDKYRLDNKPVEKTISLPSWMAKEAERKGVSLSEVTKDALRANFGMA